MLQTLLTHWHTVTTALFRPNAKLNYYRERIYTPDYDFLDLDWSRINSKKLVILLHGLEGSASANYITNAIKHLNESGYSACALNYRGCSGEPNNLLKSYHSGKSEDLDLVVEHVKDLFQEIYLLGFSVGGNICLKYLGENADTLNPKIKAAATFAVPVSLESCAYELAKPANYLYMKNFLLKLKQKIKEKEKKFPGKISTKGYSKLKNFVDYDEKYTAPLNGFSGAKDYWTQASSNRVLDRINIPTLIVNSLDDPFLGEECYPVEIANKNPNLKLELPEKGGHLAFWQLEPGKYWQEARILEFFENLESVITC